MPAIQLVVFDMAGTTVHDEDGVNRCIREAFEAVGLAAAAPDVNRVMGLPKPQAIALLIEKYGRTADLGPRRRDPSRLRPCVRPRSMRRTPRCARSPGSGELFDRLRSEGIRVALNTGFNRAITDVILGRLGWRERIDASIASDEVAPGRSPPGYDPRTDETVRRGESVACRQGRRYAGGSGGRAECGMWPDRRGDLRDAYPCGTRSTAAHPSDRGHPSASGHPRIIEDRYRRLIGRRPSGERGRHALPPMVMARLSDISSLGRVLRVVLGADPAVEVGHDLGMRRLPLIQSILASLRIWSRVWSSAS